MGQASSSTAVPSEVAFSGPTPLRGGEKLVFVFACFSALFFSLVKQETMEGNVLEAFLYQKTDRKSVV